MQTYLARMCITLREERRGSILSTFQGSQHERFSISPLFKSLYLYISLSFNPCVPYPIPRSELIRISFSMHGFPVPLPLPYFSCLFLRGFWPQGRSMIWIGWPRCWIPRTMRKASSISSIWCPQGLWKSITTQKLFSYTGTIHVSVSTIGRRYIHAWLRRSSLVFILVPSTLSVLALLSTPKAIMAVSSSWTEMQGI